MTTPRWVDAAALDTLLAAAVESGRVPGIVAAIATADRLIYAGAHGRRALPEAPPMTGDTVFSIASMTKGITSVATLQLVERGTIGLDQELADFFPQAARLQVLDGFDEAGRPVLRALRRAITIRHLLTHSSGLSYTNWNAGILRYATGTGVPDASRGIVAGFDMPLIDDPGGRWEYGINNEWLGRVIEAVTGTKLDAYFRAHITGPLGMQDTGYRLGSEAMARRARTYGRAGGKLVEADRPPLDDPEFWPGGAGLMSTAPDYLRFLRMLLRGGELDGARILSPDMVADINRNHIGALNMLKMMSARPEASADVELFPGMQIKWGLGFMVNPVDVPGRRRAGSFGWAGLRNTYYWVDPASGIAAVFLMQLLPFGDPEALQVMEAFETAAYRTLR